MADAMRHRPWQKVELWQGEIFCGGRVHLGVLNPAPQPAASEDGRRVWFDGHYFASPTATEHRTPSAAEVVALLSDRRALSRSDGIHVLASFDAERGELTLANDRLGYRPLYFTETADWFAYAGEVKALLAIRDPRPPIDEVSLRQFFAVNAMIADRTWWQGIELLPPAALWRISSEGTARERYWAFDELPAERIDLGEAREEFARLWALEVRRHSRPGTMPMLLSGGQDSRLLLAELLAQGRDVLAVTFGSRESPETARARQVARVAGVPHRYYLLDTENWWHRREEAIWHTDGLVNASHFNSAITMDVMHSGNWYSAVNLGGDLIFGGSHLKDGVLPDWQPATIERWLNQRYIANPFFSREEFIASSLDDAMKCAGGPSSDCLVLRSQHRRYMLYFPTSLMTHSEFGFPGLGLQMLGLFLGSIPREARQGSKFYNAFLAAQYPKYFLNIPWEQDGRGLLETLPVKLWRDSRSHVRGALRSAGRRVRRWLPRDLQTRAKRLVANSDAERVPMSRWFVDFQRCLDADKVTERLLHDELMVDDLLKGSVKRALAGSGTVRLTPRIVIAVLTLETYLRQVTGTDAAGPAEVVRTEIHGGGLPESSRRP